MTTDTATTPAITELVEMIGFTQAHVASTCAEGHDLTPPPELLRAIENVRAEAGSMLDLAEAAWGVIANVSGSDWTKQTAEWQDAAARWRERYHTHLNTSLPNAIAGIPEERDPT